MQISTRTEDFIVDNLKLRVYIGPYLREVFKDPTKRKVMHDADNDVLWLQRDFGIYICTLYQTADWRLRPLPYEMLRHAIYNAAAFEEAAISLKQGVDPDALEKAAEEADKGHLSTVCNMVNNCDENVLERVPFSFMPSVHFNHKGIFRLELEPTYMLFSRCLRNWNSPVSILERIRVRNSDP
ncbi:hypothetical protein VNO77_14914 [Canavalia gladiata]|uniref:3'-5' exonuclease domain-containing protein n=1 Tax=Canavalia gladiata TaxID=3824 RepID=A0AAN9QVL9_CANGL